MKRRIIRVGDSVRVSEPVHAINRVGYPLHYMEVDIDKMDDGPLKELAKTLDGWDKDGLLDAIRKTYVRQKGFGGRERRVIRHPDVVVPSGVYTVTEKAIRKTGRYVSGYTCYWSNDCEPAYLEDVKTVKLLKVVHEDAIFDPEHWILSTECELVEGADA